MKRSSIVTFVAFGLAATLTLTACGDDAGPVSGASAVSGRLSGDGSSTVFPIMEAVAEDIRNTHPGISIEVGESGTGGGFVKFCKGETDFSNASRAIKDSEAAECTKNGVAFTEFKIAVDGLSVVTNKALAIDCLTVEELKKLWIANSSVKKYGDLKAGLPAKEVKLFGPGSDSGTYDFFLEAVLGKDAKFRTDAAVTTSEDDNVLVSGVQGTDNGLGYFGFAYYAENAEQLNVVGVDGGKGCVKPTEETIRDGSYAPLSRPLFVYLKNDVLATPAGAAFIRFVLTDGRKLIKEVRYVELTEPEYTAAIAKIPAS